MKIILQYGLTKNYGGVEAFIMNIYENIDRNNFKFLFWIDSNEPIPYEEEIKSLGGIVFREKYVSRRKNFFRHYIEIIKCFKTYDLHGIHLNKANIRNIDLLIIAFFFNVKIRIFHSHIALFNTNMSLLERVNKLFIRMFSTDLVACSDIAGKYMFGKSKFKVIPDGVDVKKYKFNKNYRSAVRKKFEINDKTFVIGNVGRLSKQKNSDFVVRVFSEVHKVNKEAKLFIIGDGPLRDKVLRNIAKYNLRNNVFLIDGTSNVEKFYSAMDSFIFPSEYEGFGMALLEAQIAGLSCFASKDRIPSSVDVTETVQFISLKKDAKYWADKILARREFDRFNNFYKVKNSEFNIETTVSIIKKMYLTGES